MSLEIAEVPVCVAAADAGYSKNLRWVELALVMFVAFARSIFASSYVSIYGAPSTGTAAAGLRYASIFIEELSALLVLAYVLHRSGRSFLSLGLRASWRGSAIRLGAGRWTLGADSYSSFRH